jgi:hypothetical protein
MARGAPRRRAGRSRPSQSVGSEIMASPAALIPGGRNTRVDGCSDGRVRQVFGALGRGRHVRRAPVGLSREAALCGRRRQTSHAQRAGRAQRRSVGVRPRCGGIETRARCGGVGTRSRCRGLGDSGIAAAASALDTRMRGRREQIFCADARMRGRVASGHSGDDPGPLACPRRAARAAVARCLLRRGAGPRAGLARSSPEDHGRGPLLGGQDRRRGRARSRPAAREILAPSLPPSPEPGPRPQAAALPAPLSRGARRSPGSTQSLTRAGCRAWSGRSRGGCSGRRGRSRGSR